jgi:hypothetical protein
VLIIGADLAESRVECYILLKEFPELGSDAELDVMQALASQKSNPGNIPASGLSGNTTGLKIILRKHYLIKISAINTTL